MNTEPTEEGPNPVEPPAPNSGNVAGRSGKDSRRWIVRVFTWLGRYELSILISVLLIVGGLWGFVVIADQVVGGETKQFDQRVLLSLRNPADLTDPLGPLWVEELVRDFTALGGLAVMVTLTIGVVGYFVLDGRTRTAWFITIAVVGGTGLSILMKRSFDRPRPDLVPHGSHVSMASFPSGHTLISTTAYLTLGSLLAGVQKRRRMKGFVFVFAMLLTWMVGFSRVYLGVHWPTDVLAGWLIGLSWATACFLCEGWLQRRGAMEAGVGPVNGPDSV